MPAQKKSSGGIKSWAEQDRPREKLLLKGPAALSDAELLTILISSGTKEKSAFEIAKELLESVDNDLNTLGTLSVQKIQRIKGLKQARSLTIAAALELGRRRKSESLVKKPKISCSKDAYEFIYPYLADKTQEIFFLLMLSRNNIIIKLQELSKGGLTGTVVDFKTLFSIALDNNANSIMVFHNHPSGNLNPSDADNLLTKRLNEASQILEIKLLDHIIFAGNNYYSFADNGLL